MESACPHTMNQSPGLESSIPLHLSTGMREANVLWLLVVFRSQSWPFVGKICQSLGRCNDLELLGLLAEVRLAEGCSKCACNRKLTCQVSQAATHRLQGHSRSIAGTGNNDPANRTVACFSLLLIFETRARLQLIQNSKVQSKSFMSYYNRLLGQEET